MKTVCTTITRSRRNRASTLLMALVYTLLFAALASSMVAFSQGNMSVQQAETDANQALTAAESGMSYLLLQFKTVGMPTITEGDIGTMANPNTLWSGTSIEGFSFPGTLNPSNNGIAVQLVNAINGTGAYSGTVAVPTGTSPLLLPAITVDPANPGPKFTLSVTWNPTLQTRGTAKYAIIHCVSTGQSRTVSRSVSIDVYIQKTLKYAVYSNVAIQLGKNVHVKGDIASSFNGTSKGPPIQMFSDFHYLPNSPQIDTDLASLRGLLASYDKTHNNRLNVSDPASSAAIAAKNAGLKDLNADGYVDDFDIALKNFDYHQDPNNPRGNGITEADFNNPNTGNSYDADLFKLFDASLGYLMSGTTHDRVNGTLSDGSGRPWQGYDDGTIDSKDPYAKVSGTVRTALPYAQWQSAAAGWGQWGDTSGGATGTTFNDVFEGPVIPSDPNASPVQFGPDTIDQTATPASFDTSSYDGKIPNATASTVKSGATVTGYSGGTLTASMANGGTVTEHSPASVTSGWQATYSRPVFTGLTFNNVRIPQGLNAKFVNCTFTGYTSIKLNTNVTTGGTVQSNGSISGGTTTSDPNAGMTWSQRMISGSFNANTALTKTNSVAFTQGNNLHFSGCNFNGGLSSDVPTAYTHFANSWEFDGSTTFNNQNSDQSYTVLAPNTNIEVGGYVDPSGNISTLVGSVVAGNIDIRGSANVDGSLVVTGNGATNTTLGYFGTTDQGQAVPNLSQLPASANGSYGHLYFQNNPNRPIPNGIKIPVVATPQSNTYQIN